MGVLYTVVPINEALEWLATQEIPYPQNQPTIQPLTPALILEALNRLAELEKHIHRSLERGTIDIALKKGSTEESTTLILLEVQTDEEPCSIYFSKGHETVIEMVLAELARDCGPFLLYPDYGDDIRVVTETGPYL